MFFFFGYVLLLRPSCSILTFRFLREDAAAGRDVLRAPFSRAGYFGQAARQLYEHVAPGRYSFGVLRFVTANISGFVKVLRRFFVWQLGGRFALFT